MAKKKSNRRPQVEDDSKQYDDRKYEGLRYSLTYDYDEYSYTHACSLVLEQGSNVCIGVAIVTLIILVVLLVVDETAIVPAVVLLVICAVASALGGTWRSIQMRYANGTSLAQKGPEDRRHVVVCEDAIHVEYADGSEDHYELAKLKYVRSAVDYCIICFEDKGFVFVPRSAMSVNRFRNLVRELQERAELNKTLSRSKGKSASKAESAE